MDEKIKELGTYIDNLRQEKNLGFNQLSKKSGVNAKTLNEIMYGKSKRVNPIYLIQLAKALGVHYKQFYWIIGYLLPEDDIVKNKKIGGRIMWALPIVVILIVIALIYILKSIKIVPESRVLIVEKLGKYDRSLSSGLSFLNPFFDRVARSVSLKEQVVDFPPQPVITKDNATMQIDTVVYFQITDPKLYTYGVERPLSAIENLTATTLRNIIGDMTVDQTLTSRDIINTKMRQELDDATDPWGIKVNRVELKSILPPADIRVAMEKEMKAEREKRANILEAQAKREAAILVAEGEKQAAILRAEAKKEQQIKEAEGEAEAILSVQRAKAEALRLLNEASPNEKVLSLRGLEAFEKVADGKATKIIIPSNMQNLASIATAFSELTKNDNEIKK